MDWTMRAQRIQILPWRTFLSCHFYLCSFDLVCSELMQLQSGITKAGPVSQAGGEAEVYIRLFPSHHKKLFFSIIIQGSLFINIFYKTNINFTSPAAAGSMTRWDWKCLMRNFINLDTLKTESKAKVLNQNEPQNWTQNFVKLRVISHLKRQTSEITLQKGL